MIIVNQKKDGIVNFNNVKNLWIDLEINKKIGNHIIKIHQSEKADEEDIVINKSASIYADEEIIGQYETEERAKEVLKSIKAAYQSNKILECSESIGQNIIAEKFLEVGMIPFEYNMPEK